MRQNVYFLVGQFANGCIEELGLALGRAGALQLQAAGLGQLGGQLVLQDETLLHVVEHAGVHRDTGLGHADDGPQQVGVMGD